MDFNKDDELDYEEDDLQNDFESKNNAENETNENSNISGSDDQYIQINYPEEEENFIKRLAVGNESAETQNDKKTFDSAELEKPRSGKEQCTQKNNSNSNSNNNNNNNNNSCSNSNSSSSSSNSSNNSSSCNSNDKNNNINSKKINKKCKKKKRPFRYRLSMKKPPASILTVSSSSPNWDFSSPYNVMKLPRKSVHNEQILDLNQHFYSNPGSQFHLLGLSAVQLEQNLPQLLPICDRSLRHGNVKTNVIKRNENLKNTQNFNIRVRGLADKYQICEAKNSFNHWALHGQNNNSINVDDKNHGGKSNNSFFNGPYNPLKGDEKELVNLKKEARLKRFMSDDIVRKERKSINSDESEIKYGLNLGAEYFQKLEEQKLTREKFLSLKGQQRKYSNFDKNASTEKPDINKDSLLKKRNPFDANSGKPNCSLTNIIKQEEKERHNELKSESFDGELFIPVNQPFRKKEERKPLTMPSSSLQDLCVVKSETSSPVKFVRTISKSFDELSLRRFKIKVLENKDESSSSNMASTLPFVAANKMSYSNIDLPTQLQTESQLTGCIVKVFNIPPSTTTNDILAMCFPIGTVKEIKLNLPKENSVVIRFGEPACAENFFSIYHGQKMNNYFLNVIVI